MRVTLIQVLEQGDSFTLQSHHHRGLQFELEPDCRGSIKFFARLHVAVTSHDESSLRSHCILHAFDTFARFEATLSVIIGIF